MKKMNEKHDTSDLEFVHLSDSKFKDETEEETYERVVKAGKQLPDVVLLCSICAEEYKNLSDEDKEIYNRKHRENLKKENRRMSEGLIEELKDVAEHLDFNVQMYEFDNKAMDEDPEGHKNMIGMEKKFLQTVLDTICYLGEKDIQWFDEVHQHNYDLNTKFDKN